MNNMPMNSMPMMMSMPMSMMGGMSPMMCKMSFEMGKDGMTCKMMPADAAQMDMMRERCTAMMAAMTAGMPCMMMCGGMMMVCTTA